MSFRLVKNVFYQVGIQPISALIRQLVDQPGNTGRKLIILIVVNLLE